MKYIDNIIENTESYLCGKISGYEVIAFINEIVSSDHVYTYSDNIQIIIMSYQDILSSYVEDCKIRSESETYYGPEKLRSIILDMRNELSVISNDYRSPSL